MAINKLADQYTAAKAVLDAAEAEVAKLKSELEALGLPEVEGRSCYLTIGQVERSTLVKADVVAALGNRWVKDHTKTTTYSRITISHKPTKSLVRDALENLEA